MIPEPSYHRVGVASPLTLVDDVDLVNGEFRIVIAQAPDVTNELFVLH